MLRKLQGKKPKEGYDGQALLAWWHRVMQDEEEREYCNEFFTTVVLEAKSVSCQFHVLTEFITLGQRQSGSFELGRSLRRKADWNTNIETVAMMVLPKQTLVIFWSSSPRLGLKYPSCV